MKSTFHETAVIYKRGRDLKEKIGLLLYPRPKHTFKSSISRCGSFDSRLYVGSATNFKNRFRTHKCDIHTKKDCCGTARHFNNKCCNPDDLHNYLAVEIIIIITPVSVQHLYHFFADFIFIAMIIFEHG